MTKVSTQVKPIEQLLSAFYQDNPRSHSLDTDITILAERLLSAGWCEHVTYNDRNKTIVDGHGRVLAAEWLSQQDPEWFNFKLSQYMLKHPELTNSESDRFNPLYWQQVPVIVTSLDDVTHAALTIGLNNEKASGIDNPTKIKALVDMLDDSDRALIGFEAKVKRVIEQVRQSGTFIDEDTKTSVTNSNPKTATDTEFQDKQRFESPDATDYSVSIDEGDNDAEFYSGDVGGSFVSNHGGEAINGFVEDELPEPEPPIKKEPEKTVLPIALPWLDHKKFKAWQKANGCESESVAFWKGMQSVFPEELKL